MSVVNVLWAGGWAHTGTQDTGTDAPAGSNLYLLAFSRGDTGITTSGVTWNGVSLNNIGSQGGLVVWDLIAPASGSHTIAFDHDSGINYFSYAFFSGVDQTTPHGTLVKNSGNSATINTGSITVPSNGLAYCALWAPYTNYESITLTSGTQYSTDRTGGSGMVFNHGERSTTGDYSGYINAAQNFEAIGVPINPVSSTTPISRIILSRRGAVGRSSEY